MRVVQGQAVDEGVRTSLNLLAHPPHQRERLSPVAPRRRSSFSSSPTRQIRFSTLRISITRSSFILVRFIILSAAASSSHVFSPTSSTML